jgi:hypothetical protein
MEHKPFPTDLARFVAERIEALFDGNKNAFTEALYQRLKKTPTRGSSGLVHMVLKGDRPIPRAQEEAWARTLGVLPGSEERKRFAAMCLDQRAWCSTGGAGEEGAALIGEVRKLRAENAKIKAENARLKGQSTSPRP